MPTVIQQFDTAVVGWMNSWVFQNEWWDTLIIFRVEWLSYWFVAGLIAFGVLAFLPRYRANLRRSWEMVFVALAAGFIARFGITELIRLFYDRPRPFVVLPDLHQLVYHNGGGSFPSGHAAFFFALAAVIGRYYPKTSILFYAAAFSLTVSRVVAGIHWPSDILGGAVAGIAIGLLGHFIYRKLRKLKSTV